MSKLHLLFASSLIIFTACVTSLLDDKKARILSQFAKLAIEKTSNQKNEQQIAHNETLDSNKITPHVASYNEVT